MEHCRTYSTAVLVIEKSESPLSSTSKRNREDNRATRVSDQSSLWPGSVPGWQPSRERLPPASWAEVGLGVGMMALSCAVVCWVEYSYSGPPIDTPVVLASR